MATIRVGDRVQLDGYTDTDDPTGERVKAVPGEALDEIPGDVPRVSVRWEQNAHIWRTREYVDSLVRLDD